MGEKRINYAVRYAGQFKSTFSCTNSEVDEDFFNECMKSPQFVRGNCEPMDKKANCEQCEHFGRRAEFFSTRDNEVTILDNALGKELAE